MQLNTADFNEASVVLKAVFYKSGKRIPAARQKIIFFNPVQKKQIIPDFLRLPAKEFEKAEEVSI